MNITVFKSKGTTLWHWSHDYWLVGLVGGWSPLTSDQPKGTDNKGFKVSGGWSLLVGQATNLKAPIHRVDARSLPFIECGDQPQRGHPSLEEVGVLNHTPDRLKNRKVQHENFNRTHKQTD